MQCFVYGAHKFSALKGPGGFKPHAIVDMTILSVYAACMATKTISIDLEAYERLSQARISPKDSFSRVIKRAKWEMPAKTCGGLLQSLAGMPVADDDVLDRLERAQAGDEAPDHPWA